MNNVSLIKVMQAIDPLFPIGAFTLSNGMETYVQRGIVSDRESLLRFLKAYVYTLPTGDLGFAAKAAKGEDYALLDELFSASKSPLELRSGSEKLCRRFIKSEALLNSCPLLEEYSERIAAGVLAGSHPVAMGLFIRDIGANLTESLEMYCYSLLSASVNHAVKLVPLRQSDGQSALSEMIDGIPETVQKALNVSLYDLGIGGSGFDLRSMEHEALPARLYIS
ncbi:MAG: hypothetical protein LIO69_03165 [Oscillospiraceae bacterium]|nr:hypothetical protein [Oscillospiraceae bacterium]